MPRLISRAVVGRVDAGRPLRAAVPAVRKPRETLTLYHVLMVALVFVYVWRLQDLFPVVNVVRLPILVSLAAIALFLGDGWYSRARVPFRNTLVKLATFILVWMVLSVPGGVYPGLSLRFIINDHVKTYVMMLMLVASIRQFRDVERLVLANVFGASLYCVKVLTSISVGASGRLGDLFYYDANDLAMFLVCTLPMLVYLMRPGSRTIVRLIAPLLAGLFIVTIVKCGSRGAFLGLIAVAVFLVFGFRAIAPRIRVGAVALCAALLFFFAGPAFWTMMGTMLNPKDDYNFNGNEAGRMAVWKRGIGYAESRPVFGVGANAFPQAEGMISELVAEQRMGHGVKWSAAHNSFVQVAAELGVPGFLAFVGQLVGIVVFCVRVSRERHVSDPDQAALSQTLIATVIGYAVAGFFLSQAYATFLYATTALVVGLVSLPKETASQRAKVGADWPNRKRARPLVRMTLPPGPA